MTGPDLVRWTALVVAKAPVPGLAKTRLAATVGDAVAADLAAAAFLDTVEAVRAHHRVLALTGDLAAAARAGLLAGALDCWHVLGQRGDDFAARLAHAHADAAALVGGPVVQVGTDTPQLTSRDLAAVVGTLAGHDAVLGPATDGGWWVLGVRDASAADALRGVPMSTPTTYDDTLAALRGAGLDVGGAPVLTDVDTAADADLVARQAPHTRFARAWSALETVA